MKKIVSWIKENSLLIVVLVIALAIRIYLFIKLGAQPHWWDSAEYMAMARAWAFNIPYVFHPVRPILLPLIFAFFMKFISPGEMISKIFLRINLPTTNTIYYLIYELSVNDVLQKSGVYN